MTAPICSRPSKVTLPASRERMSPSGANESTTAGGPAGADVRPPGVLQQRSMVVLVLALVGLGLASSLGRLTSLVRIAGVTSATPRTTSPPKSAASTTNTSPT
jgi:hypothetical protein